MFDFGSIGKWLEERLADINIFDGGRTAATVQAERAGRPAPAQTVSAQPRQVVPAQTRTPGISPIRPFNTGVQSLTTPTFRPPKPVPSTDNQGATLSDAGRWIGDNVVKPIAETASRAGNTAALLPAVVGAKLTGQNNNPEVQKQLSGMLDRSFISPETAGGKASVGDFAKGFTNAGVETSNLLPVKGAVTGLAKGLSQGAVKNSLVSNAKQAAIYGSAATANDALQGREVTLGNVAANYGAPFAIGAGAEIAGGAARSGLNATKSRVNEIQSQPGYNSQAGFAKVPQVSEPVKKLLDYPQTTKQSNFRYDTDEAVRQAQKERQGLYSEGLFKRARDTFQRSVFDPRNVEQRLDNQEFARLKSSGLTRPGQTGLLPEQSLADLRGRIENPYRASDVRNSQQYEVDGAGASLKDIIKKYGKEEGQVARDFEQYRIYRDELERLDLGGRNTLGIDPTVMQRYVKEYETINPDAIRDNAILRQISVENLKARRDARIDDPLLYDNSVKFQYYNPRQALDPEDLQKAVMSGGVRSGVKGTQARSETSGGPVRSPLSLFLKNNDSLERELAQQQYNKVIRDRTRSGNLPGAREIIDADVAIAHRQSMRRMKELGQELKELKRSRKTAARDVKKAKTEVKVKDAANKEAVGLVRTYLKNADENSVMADLRPYADSISDKEARDLFDVLTDLNSKNTGRVASRLSKSTGISLQEATDRLGSLRQQIKESTQARRETFEDFKDTVQRNERGTQTITYKLDGETGKIEIPPDLAKQLSKLNELQNMSLVEKGLASVSNAQKILWTGILQPAFKVWNVAVKNPLLMYRNADGLSGINPKGVLLAINTPKYKRFVKEMRSRNASYENAFQSRNIQQSTADDIAARANIGTFLWRNPVKSLGDVGKGINAALASMDNAQRTSVAYGAYRRAKKQGFSEKEALDIASQAPTKVFGDFDRVSRLAQNLEVVIPYTGAIQAGARAMIRATKTKPVQTTFKDATIVGGMIALTGYSIGNNNAYYQDMIDSGKEYELDNNWTFVLPGASRNENGEWTNVFKIPLTPDLRPMNRATWKTVHKLANGEGLDPGLIGGEIFNQFTGDTANTVYDNKRTDDGKNPLNGVLSGSPLLNLIKTGNGISTFDGNPLADEFTAGKDRTEQTNAKTSEFAKGFSKNLGGTLTPLQVDQLLGMSGTFGDILQAKDGEKGKAFAESFAKPMSAGKGQSDKSKKGEQFYKDLEQVASQINDKKQYKEFMALHEKKAEGEPTNLFNTPKKAFLYISQGSGTGFKTTEVFEADRKLDSLARQRGEPGNPLFDLNPEQLRKVLTYRSMKVANAAGQNRDKAGITAFNALGLDEKWHEEFKNAESEFFKSVMGDKNGDESYSFSGEKRPELSPEQEQLQDKYFSFPSGSAERKQILSSNPWLKAYWDESSAFTGKERAALGFEPTPEKDFKGGFGRGGRGGRKKSGAFDYKLFGFDKGGSSNSSNLYNLLKKTRAKKTKKPKKYTSKA